MALFSSSSEWVLWKYHIPTGTAVKCSIISTNWHCEAKLALPQETVKEHMCACKTWHHALQLALQSVSISEEIMEASVVEIMKLQ
jgi:hypothetical protein